MGLADWHANAACKGFDVNEFYSWRGDGSDISPKIKAACKRCRVKAECLEWALYNETEGFWAGTSEKERSEIRKRRNILCIRPENPALDEYERSFRAKERAS